MFNEVMDSRENLLLTYAGLASGVPDTHLEFLGRYVRSTSPVAYSFCNFFAGFKFEPHEAAQVANEVSAAAQRCPWSRAYVTGGDPPELVPALVEAGLIIGHELTVMRLQDPGPTPTCELTQALTQEERQVVSEFMIGEFFPTHSPKFLGTVTAATRNSPFDLWVLGTPQSPLAAVMIVQSPRTAGIYNLVVRKDLRNEGIGTKLLRSIGDLYSQQNYQIILQCELDLVTWYAQNGFVGIGKVVSFGPKS